MAQDVLIHSPIPDFLAWPTFPYSLHVSQSKKNRQSKKLPNPMSAKRAVIRIESAEFPPPGGEGGDGSAKKEIPYLEATKALNRV